MKYRNIVRGRFVSRPNRFIAEVEVEMKNAEDKAGRRQEDEDGCRQKERVHVKNTGRCRELLLPGARVVLEKSDNPNRKTHYDLIAVYKEGLARDEDGNPRPGLVNIDSQAPNKAAAEWLRTLNFDVIRPEYVYGNSRIDFYMEKDGQPYLMEVKGCTLEIGGIGYFPDAPTQRGIKHLKELERAARQGYVCCAAFVVQMEGVNEVRPNIRTHPEFGDALGRGERAGVKILFLGCRVTEDEMVVDRVFSAKSSDSTEGPGRSVESDGRSFFGI